MCYANFAFKKISRNTIIWINVLMGGGGGGVRHNLNKCK